MQSRPLSVSWSVSASGSRRRRKRPSPRGASVRRSPRRVLHQINGLPSLATTTMLRPHGTMAPAGPGIDGRTSARAGWDSQGMVWCHQAVTGFVGPGGPDRWDAGKSDRAFLVGSDGHKLLPDSARSGDTKGPVRMRANGRRRDEISVPVSGLCSRDTPEIRPSVRQHGPNHGLPSKSHCSMKVVIRHSVVAMLRATIQRFSTFWRSSLTSA